MLVSFLIFGFNIHISDLFVVFLFSLLYALPTALISYFLGFYLFEFLLHQLKASYFMNVILAGFVTSIFAGLIAGFVFWLAITADIVGGSVQLALFFVIPTVIAGTICSLFFWYSTK